MTSAKYDLAIIGSGFGGSLLAMIARRLGRSVVLLEKGKHPRVVIGESSTPLSNLMLEELGTRYDLPGVAAFSKWGTWQREHPRIACGLKRGFTFYHHSLGEPQGPGAERARQLLVAASPHDGVSDTHWYRADFDHFLMQQARSLGAEYVDEVSLQDVSMSSGQAELRGNRLRREFTVRAKFVVDATGPRGFLHRALGLEENPLPEFPATQALYSHFSGAGRLADLPDFRNGEAPPYPIDDAAVHHVFDGGWIWVLQFNNGITSAGVAASDGLAARLGLGRGAEAWEQLLAQIPVLKKQFAGARAERPFLHVPRLSFRSRTTVGEGWALLPSAAGFVDPLLSTGFPLTLLGIGRLAKAMECGWDHAELLDYAERTDAELMAAARLIAALYANMGNFPAFVSLSLLYFAAVSYSETARRLGKPHLASSFLLCDSPFGAGCADLLRRAQTPMDNLEDEVLRLIDPINVAGLGDPGRRNWYPVDAEDLFRSAAKVEATPDEIADLLRRCGFADRRSTP
ncbi:MAG TPA: NAD(P)/FAD-dependent oxidoreductase [Bryobacteraceae bacterium]|nr:NAD(P)/FAD-dependent oxidoreductase [Bryobacteraceae bacterium]